MNTSNASQEGGLRKSSLYQKQAQQKPDLKAECILTPGTVIQEPGKKFVATWVYLNNGNSSWPIDVELRQVGGEIIDFYSSKNQDNMQPNSEVGFTAEIEAPEDPKLVEEPIQFQLHTRGIDGSLLGFGDVVELKIILKGDEVSILNETMGQEGASKLSMKNILNPYP